MWPDRVSNPGPLTYESGALPTALRGPAHSRAICSLYRLRYSKNSAIMQGPPLFERAFSSIKKIGFII